MTVISLICAKPIETILGPESCEIYWWLFVTTATIANVSNCGLAAFRIMIFKLPGFVKGYIGQFRTLFSIMLVEALVIGFIMYNFYDGKN